MNLLIYSMMYISCYEPYHHKVVTTDYINDND